MNIFNASTQFIEYKFYQIDTKKLIYILHYYAFDLILKIILDKKLN